MTKHKVERKPHTIHKTEIVLNKNKLKSILDRKGMGYMELYNKVVDVYGLDISYKGFMSLLSNRITWKLLYSHVISKVLDINYLEVFDIVDVDVDKVKKEREEWKAKYQK